MIKVIQLSTKPIAIHIEKKTFRSTFQTFKETLKKNLWALYKMRMQKRTPPFILQGDFFSYFRSFSFCYEGKSTRTFCLLIMAEVCNLWSIWSNYVSGNYCMNLVYWKLKKSEKNGQNISNGRDEGWFTTYVDCKQTEGC